MKIYPHPSLYIGNPSLFIKETKKGFQWGNPLQNSDFSLQLVKLKKEKKEKRAQWGNLWNFFVSGIIFGQKLIQPSYNLIYQLSVKYWQKISLYQ